MQCLSSDSETAQGNKCSLAGKTSYVFRVCSVNVIELALIHCYNTYTHTHTYSSTSSSDKYSVIVLVL